MNLLMQQNLNFQLTPHISILIPISTSVQLDLNPNPINQSTFLPDISVQPDLNLNPINQGPANVSIDNSIGTPSNNLLLRESTNI